MGRKNVCSLSSGRQIGGALDMANNWMRRTHGALISIKTTRQSGSLQDDRRQLCPRLWGRPTSILFLQAMFIYPINRMHYSENFNSAHGQIKPTYSIDRVALSPSDFPSHPPKSPVDVAS